MGNLTYKELSINTGNTQMSKQSPSRQVLEWLFKVVFQINPLPQKSRLRLLFAGSTFLLLTLPASRLLAQGLVSNDLEAASFFQIGVTRYHRNDFKDAEAAFRHALEFDPQIADARNYLGNIFLQEKRWDLAVQEYGEAIKLNPNLGDAYYNMGFALQQKGDPAAAITAYRQALVINPAMEAAQYNIGVLLYGQGQHQEAIAAYQQAITIDSSNPNAFLNLAIAQQEEGEIDLAIGNYEKALQLDPSNILAYNDLGSLLVLQGKTLEAVKVYQQAIRQNHHNASLYYNLGVALYDQGNLKTANQTFKHALREYYRENNLEQARKVEQMVQRLSEYLTPKKPKHTAKTTPISHPNPPETIFVPNSAPNQEQPPVTTPK